MFENLYPLAVVINDKYVTNLIVMLKSLFSSNETKKFRVYIFYSELTSDSIALICKFLLLENQEKKWIKIDKLMFAMAPVLDQDMAMEAYFKLIMPILLPKEINRIIYLDADIIIQGDIDPLFSINLNEKTFAAVTDLNMDRDIEYKGSLMPLSYTYFNSGVLVFDLERFRSIFKFEDALNYIQEKGHKFRFHDQEVLNALYFKEVFILDEKYNFVTLYRDRWDPIFYRIRDRNKNIIVVHYAAGNNKPWKPDYCGKFLKEYWRVAKSAGYGSEYKKFKKQRARCMIKILIKKFHMIFPDLKDKCIKSILWVLYWMRFTGRTKFPCIWKTLGLTYSKRAFLLPDEVNSNIKTLIKTNKPFMVCRIGANESFTLRTFEFHHTKNQDKAMEQLCTCAGVFPNNRNLGKPFLKCMKQSLLQADMCGVLMCPFDEYFLNKFVPKDCKTMLLHTIDPVVYNIPWTTELKGKKVLVVHPFADTIQKQYVKRKELFPGREVLPDFKLITYKAIQTSAGQSDHRFTTWFDALRFMTEEIEKIDFDIALLACGAYGLPLAANIKKMDRQAIHIGGGLQILFGIKGRRWDDNPIISSMYNNAWVYPSDDETPNRANIVEGACYWK